MKKNQLQFNKFCCYCNLLLFQNIVQSHNLRITSCVSVYTLCQELSLEDIAAKLPETLENLDLPAGIPPINASAIPSIEEGDRILQEKCNKNGGNSSYDDFMVSQ